MTTHASIETAVEWAIRSVQEIGGLISKELLEGGASVVVQARSRVLG